jgi:hypothetical protein
LVGIGGPTFNWQPLGVLRRQDNSKKIRGLAELLTNFRIFDPVVTGAAENPEQHHWPSLIAMVRYLFGEPLDKN